jgi:hypothetical protein
VKFDQLGMGNGGGSNHSKVITKHPSWSIKRDAHHSCGVPKVHNLFRGLSCYHKIVTIWGCLDSVLLQHKPLDRCLIKQMDNSR